MLTAARTISAEGDGAWPRSVYDTIVLALIGATLFFNFALCFVNTKIAAVGEAHVILAEALIMAATWGVLLLSRRPLDLRWLCFAIAIVCCAILVMILREQVQPKTVRDLIPKLKAAGAEGIVEYPLNKIVL